LQEQEAGTRSAEFILHKKNEERRARSGKKIRGSWQEQEAGETMTVTVLAETNP